MIFEKVRWCGLRHAGLQSGDLFNCIQRHMSRMDPADFMNLIFFGWLRRNAAPHHTDLRYDFIRCMPTVNTNVLSGCFYSKWSKFLCFIHFGKKYREYFSCHEEWPRNNNDLGHSFDIYIFSLLLHLIINLTFRTAFSLLEV